MRNGIFFATAMVAVAFLAGCASSGVPATTAGLVPVAANSTRIVVLEQHNGVWSVAGATSVVDESRLAIFVAPVITEAEAAKGVMEIRHGMMRSIDGGLAQSARDSIDLCDHIPDHIEAISISCAQSG